MKLIIHIDGGARGNPGPAGAGVTMQDEQGRVVFEAGFFLGEMTNNRAEYGALLKALAVAGRLGAGELDIFADSQLLVRQINGVYRVKNQALKGLFQQAGKAIRQFDRCNVRHVRREANARADELANMAMDAGRDVVVQDLTPADPRPASDNPPRNDTTNTIVLARCIEPPNPRVCPAPCKGNTTYRFDQTVPAGICLEAATELIRIAAKTRTQHSQTTTCTCPQAHCNARFEFTGLLLRHGDTS